MHQKGFAHLILLLILAGVITAGTAGVLYYKSSQGNDSDLGQSQQALETGGGGNSSDAPSSAGLSEPWESYDTAIDETEWVEQYVADNADIYTEDEQDADYNEQQQDVVQRAQEVLDLSSCDNDLQHLRDALDLMAEAQSVGLIELGDKLFDKAEEIYRNIIHTRAPIWENDPSEGAVQEWLYYWNLGQRLGLEDFANQILQGDFYTFSACDGLEHHIQGTPLDKQVEILLNTDFCEATIEDIRQALRLVERLQLLNKDGDDEIFDWVKDAFTAIVAKNHENWDEREKAEYSGLAAKLTLLDLSDEIISSDVNLEQWLKTNCTGGGYSVKFDDVTLVNDTGDGEWIYKFTNAEAHTCGGIYSKWEGTMDSSWELVIPGYPTQGKEATGQSFSFTLVDEESANAGATLVRKDGTQLTVWLPMASVLEGGSNLVGNYYKDPSACNRD